MDIQQIERMFKSGKYRVYEVNERTDTRTRVKKVEVEVRKCLIAKAKMRWYVTEKKKPSLATKVLACGPQIAVTPVRLRKGIQTGTFVWETNMGRIPYESLTHWMPILYPEEIMFEEGDNTNDEV